MRYQCISLVLALLAKAAWAGTPAIIPLPQQMQVRPGVFTLCPTQPVPGAPAQALTPILVDAPSLETGQYLAALLFKSAGYQFQVRTNASVSAAKGAILLTTANALPGLGPEGYELTVAPDSVVIRAPAQAGIFYGVQSLLQLLPPEAFAPHPVQGVQWTVPCVYIQDKPRFGWRGCMLDVVRHFFTKDEIKRLLDEMALHKLNTFHWHLVDDQGWRIEILKYPLLTQVGAWRNQIQRGQNPRASTAWNASGKYGGYYTQADVREIVAYAQQRHITIVPEIEMPGHSTAALQAYPQYSCSPTFAFDMDNVNYTYDIFSPGTTGTFQFLQDILMEVIGLFPSQYIHTGGDEVSSSLWKTYAPDMAQMQALGINPGSSTAVRQYQSWFSGQMANFLRSQGRTLIGWTEIEYGGILTNAVCMDWITGANSQAVATASARQYVVMTPNASCYFNYYMSQNYAVEPYFNSTSTILTVAKVYGFDPLPSGLAAAYTNYILGADANLWTEYVPSQLNVEYKLFPRLCALAETTWTPAALKNAADFDQRLTTHLQRLTQMGVNYNRTNATRIGSWSQPVSTSYTTVNYDITPYVMSAGEIDVSFYYTSGANGLDIQWTALLENGAEIDRDSFAAFAGSSYTALPIYVLHLPIFKAGAIYTIRASVAARGGTASNGTVYLTNWN